MRRLTKKSLKEFCENFIRTPRISCPPNLAKVSVEGRELLYKAELAQIPKSCKGNTRRKRRKRLRSMFGLSKPKKSMLQVVATGFIKGLNKEFDLGIDLQTKGTFKLPPLKNNE